MNVGSLAARPWVVVVFVVYFVGLVAIAAWAWRRTRDAADFFVAGRRPGVWVLAVATMSTAFSGFVFVGGPGLTYVRGTVAMWIAAPVGITAALACWTVGRRLRMLAEVREVFTVPDVLRLRWGRPAALAGAVAVVVGSVGYLGVQLLVLGRVLEAVLGLPAVFGEASFPIAMALGLGVTIAYSAAGGMIAALASDVVQGAIMLATAVALFALALAHTGGWSAMLESIAASDRFGPAFLDPAAPEVAWTAIGYFFVFGIGILGQPHMLRSYLMLRDPGALSRMPAILGVSQSIVLAVWLGVGLAVPALVAGGKLAPLSSGDEATTAFLSGFAPDAIAALALAGVVAAIMSTSDSFMNAAAAAIARDIPRALGRPSRDELAPARRWTVALGVAAAAVAWVREDLVAIVGLGAFGIFAASLGPVLVVGLATRRVGSRTAFVAIVTGLGAGVLLEAGRSHGIVSLLGLPEGTVPAAIAMAASFGVLGVGVAHATLGGRVAPLDDAVATALELDEHSGRSPSARAE